MCLYRQHVRLSAGAADGATQTALSHWGPAWRTVSRVVQCLGGIGGDGPSLKTHHQVEVGQVEGGVGEDRKGL